MSTNLTLPLLPTKALVVEEAPGWAKVEFTPQEVQSAVEAGATWGAQCNASIRHSTLWPQLQVLYLKINMRVQPNVLNQEYAKWIAEIILSYTTLWFYRITPPDYPPLSSG